jgi:hypothetical protein
MGTIDPAVAKEMVKKYAETRKKLIDQTYGIDDTISIWFSVDEIKKFVASLSPDASGARIYLGVYSDAYPYTPDQTCIIAIQTTKDSSGNDVDSLQQEKLAAEGGGNPYNQGKVCPPLC